MASVADRNRARKVRTAARAEEAAVAKRAADAGVIVGAGPRELEARTPYVRRITGLDFLYGRSKLSGHQYAAGERYGRAFRLLELRDGASIKSGLAEPERVGGGGAAMRPPELDGALALQIATARAEIDIARSQALLNHTGLVAVVDVICGKQWTPGEVSKLQREQEEVVTALRIALDLLVDHYRGADELRRVLDKSN